MASNPDFVQYIVDQSSGAGEVTARKMFGDYTLYCDGKVVGLVSDNAFYIKPTPEGKQLLKEVDMRPPYAGAKPYFYIEDVDDRSYIERLVKTTCAALPESKKRR